MPVRVLSDAEDGGGSAGVSESVSETRGKCTRGASWRPPVSPVTSVSPVRTRLFPSPSLPFPRRLARCLGPTRKPRRMSVFFGDERRFALLSVKRRSFSVTAPKPAVHRRVWGIHTPSSPPPPLRDVRILTYKSPLTALRVHAPGESLRLCRRKRAPGRPSLPQARGQLPQSPKDVHFTSG